MVRGKVHIIGAGPVGCYLAGLLAPDYEVCVYEEHKSVGLPVQCTGILTSGIKEFVGDEKSFIVNVIDKARIIGPDRKGFMVKMKRPNILVDRTKFDTWFYKRAKRAGAIFRFGHRFVGVRGKENKNLLFNVEKKKVAVSFSSDDILVGADGVNSKVYEMMNDRKRRFFVAPQVRLKLKNDGAIDFFAGEGHFAWIVPEDRNVVRAGIVEKKKVDFFNFMERIDVDWKKKILGWQSGTVPLYDPKSVSQKGNLFVVGDAAGHVKATTAGGIIQGLTAAKCLAESIRTGKDYEKMWKKRIDKDLWLHKKLHEVMSKFSSSDFKNLVKVFSEKKNRKILEEFDRDYPSKYIFRLISEVRLWRFIKYLI